MCPNTPINLDTPLAYPGLTIVTFEDTANPTSGLGSSFADVPNLFGDGTEDLVIGEPGASLNGKTGNGGVFVFPVGVLSNHDGCEQRRPGPGAVALHIRGCQQWRCRRVLGRRVPVTSTG